MIPLDVQGYPSIPGSPCRPMSSEQIGKNASYVTYVDRVSTPNGNRGRSANYGENDARHRSRAPGWAAPLDLGLCDQGYIGWASSASAVSHRVSRLRATRRSSGPAGKEGTFGGAVHSSRTHEQPRHVCQKVQTGYQVERCLPSSRRVRQKDAPSPRPSVSSCRNAPDLAAAPRRSRNGCRRASTLPEMLVTSILPSEWR